MQDRRVPFEKPAGERHVSRKAGGSTRIADLLPWVHCCLVGYAFALAGGVRSRRVGRKGEGFAVLCGFVGDDVSVLGLGLDDLGSASGGARLQEKATRSVGTRRGDCKEWTNDKARASCGCRGQSYFSGRYGGHLLPLVPSC